MSKKGYKQTQEHKDRISKTQKKIWAHRKQIMYDYYTGRPFDDEIAQVILNVKDWGIEYTIENDKIIITGAVQRGQNNAKEGDNI